MPTTNGNFTLHKAVVHSVNTVTGVTLVHVPAITGNDVIPIPPMGLPVYEGVVQLPAVGDVRLVAIDSSGSAFHWVVTADATEVWGEFGTHAASIGVLEAEITAIELGLAGRRLGQVGTYRIDNTIGGDPVSGDMRYNNATQTSATVLTFDHIDQTGADIDLYLANLRVGDTVIIQDQDVSDSYQHFLITATPTGSHVATYYSVPVSFVTSNGTGTTGFANNHVVTVSILYTGVSTTPLDHGALTGLADNDHPQYGLKAGQAWTGTHTYSTGTHTFSAGVDLTGSFTRNGDTAKVVMAVDTYILSTTLDTTTSAQDIAGCTTGTMAQAANDIVEVSAVYDVRIDTTGIAFVGTLDINGAEQTAQAIFKATGAGDRATVAQQWRYVVPSTGNYTYKLRGRTASGATGDAAVLAHTTMIVKVYR